MELYLTFLHTWKVLDGTRVIVLLMELLLNKLLKILVYMRKNYKISSGTALIQIILKNGDGNKSISFGISMLSPKF